MNSRWLVSIGSLLLAFVLGLGLGFFMGGAPSSGDTTDKTPATSLPPNASSSEAETHNSLLESRIVELEKEIEDQKKDQDALILQDRLALFKKYPHAINSQALDENLKVTPAMVELLKLSPEEKQAIEQHLKESQDETLKIEDAKMSLVKRSGNTVTYEIPTYANEGGKEIKAKLNSLLSSDIGEARAEVFIANSGYAFTSQFSDFGEGKTQIEITPTDQNGIPSFKLKESYFYSTGANTTNERTIGTLPQRYQRLLQTEPAQ